MRIKIYITHLAGGSGLILLLALTFTAGGCKTSWSPPWAKKEVPITNPVSQTPVEPEVQPPAPTPTPQTQPAPAAVALPGPQTQPELNRPAELTDLLLPGRLSETLPTEVQPDQSSQKSPTVPTQPTGPGPISSSRPMTSTKPVMLSAGLLQVNDKYLTIDDVLRHARPRLSELPATVSDETFREQAEKIIYDEIQRLVIDTLVYAEAQKRLGEEITKKIEEELADSLRDMIAQAGGSRKNLEAECLQHDMTLENLLADQRQKLFIRVYLQSRFTPTIVVTRQMLVDYYHNHEAEFSSPAKVQMQILASPYRAYVAENTTKFSSAEIEAAKAAANQNIRQAQEAIKGGMDFTKAVEKFSKAYKAGGDGVWPLMTQGSFKEPAVEQAAFALAEGQVSDIIDAPNGLYLVKAVKVEPGKKVAFEDAQAQIEEKIRDEQHSKMTDDYFKELLTSATVVVSDKVLPAAIEKALEKRRK